MRASTRTKLFVLGGGTLALALAIAGLWFYVDFVNPAPFYTRNYDPEMAYFMNSLAIFKSQPYMYIDHPGTPVEVIGTIIMALMRPVLDLGSDAFWTYLITRPEVFLRVAHGFLTICSIGTLVFICLTSIKIRRWTDVLLALGAGASFFALLPSYAFDTLTFWSHNSFNFAAGTLLLFVLLIRLRSGNPLQAWEITLAGIATGVLTAIQLYFVTWILGAAIALTVYVVLNGRGVLRGLAAGVWVGASSGIGFLLATGPIMYRYREFSWWVKGLITHQGRYGTGQTGVPSVASLIGNLAGLWSDGRSAFIGAGMVLSLLVVAGYLNRRKLKSQPGWWAMASGLTLQVLLAFLLIAKHPGPAYLLAPAAILPVMLILAFEVLSESVRGLRLTCAAVGVVAITMFGVGLQASVKAQQADVTRVAEHDSEIRQQVTSYAASHGKPADSVVILWAFSTESRCYALRFGNRYAGGVFGDEIDQLCPNEWTYEASADSVELPGGYAPLADATGWDILIIPAGDLPSQAAQYGQVTYSADGQIAFILAKPTGG